MSYQQSQTLSQKLLKELQDFRENPSSIIPYLEAKLLRYRNYKDSSYVLSDIIPKKGIQLHETESLEARIEEVENMMSRDGLRIGSAQELEKLHEIARVLCFHIIENIDNEIKIQPSLTSHLRHLVEQDPNFSYPNPLTCLVSLSFAEELDSIITLLIDDGVKSRSNRKALLNGSLKYVGVWGEDLKNDKEGVRCVIYVFADEVLVKNREVETSVHNASVFDQNNETILAPQEISSSVATPYETNPATNNISEQLSMSNEQSFPVESPYSPVALEPQISLTDSILESEPKQIKPDLEPPTSPYLPSEQNNTTLLESIEFRDRQEEYFHNNDRFKFMPHPSQESENESPVMKRQEKMGKINVDFGSGGEFMRASVDPFNRTTFINGGKGKGAKEEPNL